MKLSEIVKKIYDMNYRGECWVEVVKNTSCIHIRIEYGDGFWGLYDFDINNQTGTIIDCFDLPVTSDWKWLWKLWVDNVEIELDMDEVE